MILTSKFKKSMHCPSNAFSRPHLQNLISAFGQVFDTGVFHAMLPLIRDQQMAVRKEVDRERVEGRMGSICVHQSAIWCNITGSKIGRSHMIYSRESSTNIWKEHNYHTTHTTYNFYFYWTLDCDPLPTNSRHNN